MTKLAKGSKVRRKAAYQSHPWKDGDKVMTVIEDAGWGVNFEDNPMQHWEPGLFEPVTRFAKGQLVNRKKECLELGGWPGGPGIYVVEEIDYTSLLRFKEFNGSWQQERFEHAQVAVADENEILRVVNSGIQKLLDEATKPLHHQIELKDARIRVLEANEKRLKEIIEDVQKALRQ